MNKIPRRLRRFYRQAEQKTARGQGGAGHRKGGSEEDYYGLESGYDTPAYAGHFPREDLSSMPTMDYEDLNINEQNYRELKRFEQKKKEEALALEEIERFKEKNKRMPSKEEAERIAESIYNQLKESNVEELYPNEEGAGTEGGGRTTGRQNWRDRRARRERKKGEAAGDASPEEKIPEMKAPAPAEPIKDIKALLEDESFDIGGRKNLKNKKSAAENEFSLGEGFDDETDNLNIEEEPEEINPVEKLEKKGDVCPNCKAKTEKIIYCPKCGKAYCSKCASSFSEGKYSCPSCGAKTKI